MTFPSFDLYSAVVVGVIIFYFDPMALRTMTKKAKTNKYFTKKRVDMDDFVSCRTIYLYMYIQQCARILI